MSVVLKKRASNQQEGGGLLCGQREEANRLLQGGAHLETDVGNVGSSCHRVFLHWWTSNNGNGLVSVGAVRYGVYAKRGVGRRRRW